MNVSYDQPAAEGGQARPEPSWSDPGGPGGPEADSGGGAQRPRRRRRRLLAAGAATGLAAVTAGGIAWTGAGAATQRPLTTAQITAKTNPAVVDVVSTLGYQHGTAAGTGIVLTSTGEVLTNNHVVQGATAIKVTDVGNGRTYRAVVVGYDRKDDIAVLRLQGASGLSTVTLGNSSAVKNGAKVVGIGNAGGQGGRPSAAAGVVTALGQTITASNRVAGTSEQLTGVIRTSAAIQPGDSGGPLVNSYGQVIGINTAAASSFQVESGNGQPQSFAIPINRAVSIAHQIEGGRSSATVHAGATAFLGVESSAGAGFPGAPASAGVTIVGVASGSPAASAGLATGDEIVSVGGHRVTSAAAIQGALQGRHPGDTISIGWRDQSGQTHSASVVLATGPAG
jgi:S1-C subfamily serine protease